VSSPVISVRNIGKKYKLGATLGGRNYKTLRDVLTRASFGPFRKLSAAFRKKPSTGGKHSSISNPLTQLPNNLITKSPNNPKEFWALKDITFDVQQGEVLGIIGANGAGKSTLLKILSEITEPTEGEVRIRGRVASLLEVGTGFHPELSGRENVYMNGAILGMTKAEIDAKFDEIVAFAEVEKFIHTPIKRYSSGMQVRLAFAVAAYLEPEILLVDEVLAVGDVNFQKKCLGRMSDVTEEGRTVLFVSHNMQAIRQLAARCILLENGKIVYDGDTNVCISKYLESAFNDSSDKREFTKRKVTEERPVCIRCVSLSNGKGTNKSTFSFGEPWNLEMEMESIAKNIMLYVSAHIRNEYGINVYHFVSRDTGQDYFYSDSYLKVRMTLPKLLLYPGRYSIDLYVSRADSSLKNIDSILSAISFEVNQSAGLGVFRELGKGLAVVHEVPQWEIVDKEGKKYQLGKKN
jgi:lipopolysaccharide transport system ATP-binding protein